MPGADTPLLGFIGLGQMGAPMARNLLAAGYSLVVHNRSQAIVEAFAGEGAQPASSPREVAERVDLLFTCVGFPADVERVYLGEGGAIEGSRSGQVFCDLSTVGPETHHQIAARLSEKGVGYLDAPVSGGTSGAKAGTLTIMVGGEASHFERVRPMLDAMGKNIYLVGPTGAGATIKLVNQMMNAISIQAAAEGLVLATKAGIDPKLAHAILRTSSGGNAALDGVANAAFTRDFEPGFSVALQQKDVSLAIGLGRELGVRLLFGALAEQLIQETKAAGFAKKAPPAAIQLHEKIAGVQVVPKE
jgi:2-hydroxy-3-oxopropionate reductase